MATAPEAERFGDMAKPRPVTVSEKGMAISEVEMVNQNTAKYGEMWLQKQRGTHTHTKEKEPLVQFSKPKLKYQSLMTQGTGLLWTF